VSRRLVAALGAAGLAACGSFEDPSIVVDLRILAMTAEPPEQVTPFDPANPLATMLVPVEVCALIVDPPAARALEWSMTVCPPQSGRRCLADRPSLALGQGTIEDPETAATPQVACATVPAGAEVLAILRDTIERDAVSGFGGIDLAVSLRVVPVGGGEDQAIYGSKAVRYSPLLPAERVANTNPTLASLDYDRGGGTAPSAMPRGFRCVDLGEGATVPFVRAGEQIHIVPVEPPNARERYVLPTFEGGSRTFTENLSYQWLAEAGDWSSANTGGPRDGAGNEPLIGTRWRAPAPEDLSGPTDISLWVIQRDERGGQRWFESCVHVEP